MAPHRDVDNPVAVGPDDLPQPGPLPAQDEGRRQAVIDGVKGLGAVGFQPDNPDPTVLKPLQRPAQIRHPGHWHVLGGPGRGLFHGGGDPGRPVPGDDYPVAAGRVGRPD